MSFDLIPKELQSLPQFICWKYVQEQGSEKPTKVPINPHTGQYASPTNPEHWGSFELACSVAYKVDGIGFVITKDDPFLCLDFDPTNDPEILKRQNLIYNAFNSYSEISPSGKGCHLWIKAKVPTNRNRALVEIYTAGHYMTMTGNVCRNEPVKEYQSLASQLWEEMQTKIVNEGQHLDKTETMSDYDVLVAASSAVNGEKFIDIFEGRWAKYFPFEAEKGKSDCNEADQALCNMLAFYTQNREQIKRIFRTSVLGQRTKAKREDYFENPKWGMLNKAFDKMPLEINMDELRNNLEQQLAVKRQEAAVKGEVPAVKRQSLDEALEASSPIACIHVTSNISEKQNIEKSEYLNISKFEYNVPPGLVGDIAKFIYSAAPRPVPEIAIAGAIGLMSGICGRSYNISGTGLNTYTFLLAKTGRGKEAMGRGMNKLIACASKTVPAANTFIGPSRISSPQALVKFLSKSSNSFVSILGEFADTLKRMSNDSRNPIQQDVRIAMLDLYNKSGHGDVLGSLIYSDKDKNTDVFNAPSFSVIGEATPEKFYELLSKSMIDEGLLPRCTIIEYHGNRTELNEDHDKATPSQQLIDQFSSLCAYSLQLNNGNNVKLVQLSDEAKKLIDDFNISCDKKINTGDSIASELWSRAHIKVLKLAALLAVGCNYINPVINTECAMWALQLITNDVLNLLSKFEAGTIGAANVQNDQVTDIKKGFKRYVTSTWEEVSKLPGSTLLTHSIRVVPHSFISAFCRQRASFKNDRMGPIQAVNNCLKNLIECDDIRELSPHDKKQKGLASNAKLYMVSGMQL